MGNRQKKRRKQHVPITEEVYDAAGNYCGMIGRNEKGKWATGWNMVPEDDLSYVHDTAHEARVHLIKNRHG
jgi:hypothetical protein